MPRFGRQADYLRGLPREDTGPALCVLAGDLPRGRIGIGPAQVREALGSPPAGEATLILSELLQDLTASNEISGAAAWRPAAPTWPRPSSPERSARDTRISWPRTPGSLYQAGARGSHPRTALQWRSLARLNRVRLAAMQRAAEGLRRALS